jgi:hypothetical protein
MATCKTTPKNTDENIAGYKSLSYSDTLVVRVVPAHTSVFWKRWIVW